MLSGRTVLGAAACCLWISANAQAQVLLEPEPQKANQNIPCGDHSNPATALSALRDHYTAGRWDHLISATKAMLDECRFATETGDTALFRGVDGAPVRPNYRRDWYLLVVATVDRDDQPLVLRYIVHEPLPYPYSNHTVGVPFTQRDTADASINDASTPRLIQVFLSPNKALTLETRIQVTQTSDPVKDQVAEVVKAVFDPATIVPLLKGFSSPAIRASSAPSASAGPVYASVGRILPPFDRADYKYTDVVRAPAMLSADASVLLREKFEMQADTVAKGLETAEKAAAEAVKNEAETRISSTASAAEKTRAVVRRDAAAAVVATRLLETELAKDLANKAVTYLREQGAKVCNPTNYQGTCWTGLRGALQTATETFCAGIGRAEFCKGDREDLLLIRFAETAQPPKTTTTSNTTTFANIPYQHLSFGSLGAYIGFASASRDRVKVDSGKVVADPVGRALTSVVLNIHPAFDPKAPRMEAAERWRAFVGAVLTPNLGVSAGAGYGLLRNLSLNLGYALLAIPTIREGDQLDAAPSQSTRPFRAGAAHVAFFGLGYKFGK